MQEGWGASTGNAVLVLQVAARHIEHMNAMQHRMRTVQASDVSTVSRYCGPSAPAAAQTATAACKGLIAHTTSR
jgi:hypothetical protein